MSARRLTLRRVRSSFVAKVGYVPLAPDLRRDHPGKGLLIGWKRTLYIPPLEAERNAVVQGECLMVSCERCGYRWHEPAQNPS